jgi:hypothetical protein
MNILAIELGKFNSMCCSLRRRRTSIAAKPQLRRDAIRLPSLKNHDIDLVVLKLVRPSGWIFKAVSPFCSGIKCRDGI